MSLLNHTFLKKKFSIDDMNHKLFDFLEGKLHMTQLKLSPIFVKPSIQPRTCM